MSDKISSEEASSSSKDDEKTKDSEKEKIEESSEEEKETGSEDIDEKLEKEGLESVESNEKLDEKKDNEEIKNSSENDFYKENKEIEKIQNKQIKWAVFLMVAIVLIIVIVPFVKNNFIDKFDYKGLVFQKTQLGELVFYSTKFPVISITGQVIGDYSINMRNDPRDLEYIPVNVSEGKIEFTVDRNKYGDVYISLNPFMEVCEDSGIAMLTLSGFLSDSALNVSSAVIDKAYAKKYNLTQRWCYNSGFDTVILITDGNKTTINEIKPNCYELQFNNCEVLQVSEKFMLNILEQYTGRFES